MTTCKKCGARYDVTVHRVPQDGRDAQKFSCPFCRSSKVMRVPASPFADPPVSSGCVMEARLKIGGRLVPLSARHCFGFRQHQDGKTGIDLYEDGKKVTEPWEFGLVAFGGMSDDLAAGQSACHNEFEQAP